MTNRLFRGFASLALMLLILLTAAAALADAEGTVDTSALILRKAASKDSKALQTLDRGDRMDILAVQGDWYKVRYGKYTGYVMAKYVDVTGELPKPTVTPAPTPKPTATPKPTVTPAPTKQPAVTPVAESTKSVLRPGDVNGQVLTMQTALKSLGYYQGKLDGVYGTGTENAVRAFQKQAGLKQDGIAGSKTLGALYDGGVSGTAGQQEAADHKTSPKTESLDWFKNGNSALPRGAVFTVKDVATGKTFQVKRWAGSSHADSEPLTRDDTAIMKDIYGGSWSWTRRAILVSYNGHVYAASMNGMPHGTSTRDNGFDGHFCIHFTGSKTHGSDRVDEDHQAAVQKALKSSW